MKITLLCAVAAMALSATPVFAADRPSHSVSPQEVISTLQSQGYQGRLDKDSRGNPLVHSAASGLNFDIYFYGCSVNKCSEIQFYAGFSFNSGSPSVDKINSWNRDNRFMRSYIDSEGDPNVEMDVDLKGGYNDDILNQAVYRWTDSLPIFVTYINFKKS